ncbi:MAG: CRISPR-associated helicase Cas3', partial [Methanosarcinales archaeon]
LKEKFEIEIVEVDEKDIPVRKNRNVSIYWKDEKLTPKEVIKQYKNSKGKIIVVCNTVNKAQEIYTSLEGKIDGEVILLHSRFLEEDRKKKEDKLKEIFGQNSRKKGILIATQVIEVGLDISCDTMHTELSPIDSLIQRTGRCARWGGNGSVYVYEVGHAKPYIEKLIDDTRKKVKEISGSRLDWETEKQLVNDVLGEYVENWLKIENMAKILNTLAQAAFEGKRKLAEDAVRDVFSCEVSIYDDPYTLENAYKLKSIKIHVGVLRKFFKDYQPKMWKLVDKTFKDDVYSVVPQKISDAEEILPYGSYIIHPDYISYNENKGLLLKPKGKNFLIKEEKEERKELRYEYEKEPWVVHSKETLKVFESIFIPRYKFSIDKFARAWKIESNEFLEQLRIAILLHDLGKLNEEWQKKAGWNGKEPLAHYDKSNVKLPPHATISAYALSPIFDDWGETLGEAFYFALAHHHSVRASQYPKYKLINGLENFVNQILPQKEVSNKIIPRGGNGNLLKFPELINHEKLYRTYTFISRLLRLSDRIATGGSEDAILCYENWYGNVRCL